MLLYGATQKHHEAPSLESAFVWHFVQLVDLEEEAYVPAGHGVQDDAFWVLLYVPAGHHEQVSPFTYVPASQVFLGVWHADAEVAPVESVVCPDGHGVHDVSVPPALYVPLGQETQDVPLRY